MNGEVCCILGVCCPAGSNEQRDALATAMANDKCVAEADAHVAAEWVLKNFDLAPKGSLRELKGAIADMVRSHA